MRICNRLFDITALRVFTVVILALVTCSVATAADTAGRVYKIGFLGQTSAATDRRATTGSPGSGIRGGQEPRYRISLGRAEARPLAKSRG